MAVTHWIELSLLWLGPGNSWHGKWNNANYQCVYAVNGSPVAHESGTMEVESIRSWRTSNFNTGESEVHWLLKNTGSVAGYCYQYMSAICP